MADHDKTKIGRVLGKSPGTFTIQKNLKYIRQLGKFGEARTEAELQRVMPYNYDKEQAHGNLRPDFAVNDNGGRRLAFVETKQGDQVNARDWKQLRGDVRLTASVTEHRLLIIAAKGGNNFFLNDKSGKGAAKLKALHRHAQQKGVRIAIVDSNKAGFGNKIAAVVRERGAELKVHRNPAVKQKTATSTAKPLSAVKKGAATSTAKPLSAVKKGAATSTAKPLSAVKKGAATSTAKPHSAVKKGAATSTAKPHSAVKPGAATLTAKPLSAAKSSSGPSSAQASLGLPKPPFGSTPGGMGGMGS